MDSLSPLNCSAYSAFARYPDGVIEHYYCANLPQEQTTGPPASTNSSSSDSYQKSTYRDPIDDSFDSSNPF